MRHKKVPQPEQPPEPEPAEPEVDPCGESYHPLDDDAELAHIGDITPPPIEVSPDSDSRAGHDAPPPMVKPAAEDTSQVEHVPPLGPSTENQEGQPAADAQAAPIPSQPPRKIRTFEQRLGRGGHETMWKRQPNVTGTGAIHVKSFHCKLTGDSLEFLDSQVNEWLDEHPEYEVKMVTTSIGEWTGKLKEPALIINVWV